MNAKEFLNSARLAAFIALVSALAGVPQRAHALTTDLSATPPELNASVDPNVVLTFDESGSMAQAYVPGRLGEGDIQFGNNAGYIVDELDTNTPKRKICSWSGRPDAVDAAHPAQLIHPWGFSSAVNSLYYDPTVTYTPPYKADDSKMPPAVIAAAWNDGILANSSGTDVTTRNLTTNYRVSWAGGNSPKPDYISPATLANPASTACNPGGTGYMAFPFAGGHAFYYQFGGNPSLVKDLYNPAKYTAVDVTTLTAAQQTNFANWYSYYRTRILAARSAVAVAFFSIPRNVRVAWQRLNTKSLAITDNIRAISDPTQRANFYSDLFAALPSGGTPTRAATDRVAKYFGNTNTGLAEHNPYYDVALGRELSCRQNYHLLVTDGGWKDTPSSLVTTNTDQTDITLPDGKSYTHAALVSQIYGGGPDQGGKAGFADVAFSYWATDLRTGASALNNNVPPFIPDKSTGVTGPVITTAIGNNVATLPDEVYWNPANDPATWQHLVQFVVAFGLGGQLDFPADYAQLRLGTKTWTDWFNAPNGEGIDTPPKADDTWHGAINSRGELLNASNPQALVTAIVSVLNSILVRQGSSTSLTATLPILTQGTQGFQAGYDTSNWSGFLKKNALDPVTGATGAVIWEAGCILTGGGCASGHTTVTTARAPASRKILTSGNSAQLFDTSSLSAAQLMALRAPLETDDINAKKRVDYLRGDRTNETAAPLMRTRGSVLGAIISSQPLYISGPTGGFSDTFPAGSDEANAVATNSYSKYLYDNRSRTPTVYVGANDGMLHAFNAVDGTERWAYVPNVLITNGKLLKLTDRATTAIVPGVDDAAVPQDVFFNGTWHTVLVNTMRLGGRGVFALDVTIPDSPTVLWEFDNTTSGAGALGYTYSSANIARLATGKWVALVSSGYFQSALTDATDPTSTDVNKDKTSLLVIDLQTGALIQSIPTPAISGVATFGLSAPAVYDANSDQVDDFAVAGDLAGNLWRFDLRSTTPSSWSADLMFKDYTTAPTAAAPAVQPISVMPVALRDTVAGVPVWIFGTGKYLGKGDRVAAGTPSNVGPQAFYGIRDNGPGSPTINVSDLFTQTLTQDAAGVRTLTTSPVPLANGGWMIPLGVKRSDGTFTEPGERAVVTVLPLYASNRAVLTTLIPKGNDPCDPGRRGSIMVVSAGTGGAASGADPLGGTTTGGTGVVGKAFDSGLFSSISPPPLVGLQGGGGLVLPGMDDFHISDPPYHRGAWRELLDLL